jgi:hypothetical protein
LAFVPLRLGILCASTALALALLTSVSAANLLQNGGFEEGSNGWTGLGLSTSGCSPHTGSGALSISSSALQSIPSPIGSGMYTLEGWLKAKSGPASAALSLVWLDDSGSDVATSIKDVAVGTDYTLVSLQAAAPASAYGLRVRITASGTLCADDFSLDGPPALPQPTATPPPTATSSPSQQPTTSTSTPGPSATAKPSSTPRATSTPSPSATAPGFELLNGGFEDGLRGWSKFGGTLEAIDEPVQSGLHAGRLSSTTDSTKWAHQTVLVDSLRFFEFDGYVGSDAGVSRAHLRVSWYASSDGSGAALSTSDSTATISAASGYVYLSTGAVRPPDGARSARARIVMTPLGAGAASIVFDDLWFGAVEPPDEAKTEPDVPSSEAAAAADEAPPPTISAGLANRGRDAALPESTSQAVTSGVRSASVSPPASELPSGRLQLSQRRDRGVPLAWLAVASGFVVVAGLGYWLNKRRSI